MANDEFKTMETRSERSDREARFNHDVRPFLQALGYDFGRFLQTLDGPGIIDSNYDAAASRICKGGHRSQNIRAILLRCIRFELQSFAFTLGNQFLEIFSSVLNFDTGI